MVPFVTNQTIFQNQFIIELKLFSSILVIENVEVPLTSLFKTMLSLLTLGPLVINETIFKN